MNKIPEEILKKYREGKATAEEKKWVESWILHGADFGFDLTEKELLEDLTSIRQRLDLNKQKASILPWKEFAVAASLFLVASVSILFFIRENNPQITSRNNAIAQNEITAGDNIAVLTLSDGSKIKLDSTIVGITKEAGISIVNDREGNLTYVVNTDNLAGGDLAYNTIATPRGGTYKIVLPDGTNVWLNAASSLRFPLSFAGDSRKVELSGEGYFEVAKSKKRFHVLTHKTAVEVLGTHFNVNSYINEEATKVTLLEGSVKLISGNESALLKPGELGEVTAENSPIQIFDNRDTETVIAWTKGRFKFNNTDLKSIMRQLERWYDIEVDFNNIPHKKFNGTIPREAKLSEVISMIELTSDLKFKIKGRRLTME